MALTRVLPDTNVCFPISLLDVVLRFDEADLHRVVWTEDLLDELARTWIKLGARSGESADRVCAAIRRSFTDGGIPRQEYAHLVDSMPGPDASDHVHAAAAVSRAPVTIVTANIKDFPSEPLAELDVTVTPPDQYLCDMATRHPEDMIIVIRQMAADRRRPPMTGPDILDALERAGVPKFAAVVRQQL